MDEDETIRRLKKISFEEMRDILMEISVKYRNMAPMNSEIYQNWGDERTKQAFEHGWSIQEWQRENYRRIHLDD